MTETTFTPTTITELSDFLSFNLHPALQTALIKNGFEKPTPVQQRTIPASLTRQNLLVSAKTGSGKTLAFLLPTLHNLLINPNYYAGTRALVLVPTRELAQQIFLQCQQLLDGTSLNVGLITGGEDFKKQQNMFRKNTAVIIATPGRILELLTLDNAPFENLETLILDEADRMLDMGFSEDVLTIAKNCNENRQTLLFSATLTHAGVLKMADKVLKKYELIALNTLRDELPHIQQQIVLADDNAHKQQLLAWLLKNETFEKALVFSNSRLQATALCDPLRATGVRATVLHGDMDQKERQRVMKLFRDGVVNVLIATDLAARGLDIKGIQIVINFEVPRNGINYIHRIGRTGRSDETGLTITLVKHTEWNLMAGIERFLRQSFIRRNIKELAGKYQGPKKLKASGKTVGGKSKVEKKKEKTEKVKVRQRDQKNIGKRRAPTTPKATAE
ncbi:MAG: DEAD/DEAH box helicase [Methylococcales bacterium]|nr:DEAD/DEAH box helicase [Methylococcales bacterium]